MGQIFSDIGSGVYTRENFMPETRYEIFCNGSQGHSVPIINGQRQKHGREYNGTLNYEGSEIKIEFSAAYGLPEFDRLTRTFVYEDDRVLLTDSFDSDYDSITERFITLIKPEIIGNLVKIGNTTMRFDATIADVCIIPTEHHVSGGIEIVYCLDFKLKQGLECVTFEIIINH